MVLTFGTQTTSDTSISVIDTINQRGQVLMDGIEGILTESGIPHAITGIPPMFGIMLGSDQEPYDFRDYLTGDDDLYRAIGMELCHRGVMAERTGREPWFLCYALSDEDVTETLNVYNDSVKAAKG